ncbi:MAG: chemotaxis protein CheB [Chthoniobacteraceae bacterium]
MPAPQPPDATGLDPTLDAVLQGLPVIAPDVAGKEPEADLDNILPTRGYQVLPMVGIGGSAGGIAAMQSFFAKMPADSGMVFVVILHLSPDHESTLADLLQHSTAMRVMQAADAEKVQANCVYVIPPGKQLTAVNGHLHLADLKRTERRHVTVHLFFRTLADTHGQRSAAILLDWSCSSAGGSGPLNGPPATARCEQLHRFRSVRGG